MAAHIKGKFVSKGQRVSSRPLVKQPEREVIDAGKGTVFRYAFIAAVKGKLHLQHNGNTIWRAIRSNAGTRSIFSTR